ncbi:MAG: hypothetical protein ACN4GM_10135 [Gammaproteobacteria bacterium]
MSEGQFNCIVILDAIPEGELNTARRLRENLEDLAMTLLTRLEVRYIRITVINDLEKGIETIIDEIKSTALKPWLHLEGHGLTDESGFLTANGTTCTWESFKNSITPINVLAGFNVFLILATCFGGSFARTIVTSDRAPVLGLVGPIEEVKSGHIEDGFLAFYRAFFEASSLKAALDALNAASPGVQYYRTTAEQFFYDVWSNYKKHHCTEKEIGNRIKRIYRMIKAQKPPRLPSIGQIKRNFRSQEQVLFEKYRNCYFMYDIEKANQERFPVTYEIAEEYASR